MNNNSMMEMGSSFMWFTIPLFSKIYYDAGSLTGTTRMSGFDQVWQLSSTGGKEVLMEPGEQF